MGSTKKLNESQKNEIRIYAETNSDELYDNSSAERWVGKENLDDLKDYPNKLYLLKGIIDDERLSILENGEEPTKAEKDLYLEYVLDDFFEGDNYETGGWCSVIEVQTHDSLRGWVTFVSKVEE